MTVRGIVITKEIDRINSTTATKRIKRKNGSKQKENRKGR